MELVKVRTLSHFYTIPLSFKDKANLSDIDNELRLHFELELIKVRTIFCFYMIASSFEDKANFSDVYKEYD